MQHGEAQVPQIYRNEIERQNGEDKPRHQKGEVGTDTVKYQSQQDGDGEDITSIFLHYSDLQVSFSDFFRAAKVVFFREFHA